MAQRLVAKICPDTGKRLPLEGSIAKIIDKEFQDLPSDIKASLPKANEVLGIESTAECPKGVRGRLAVFEVVEMSKELERMILTDPTENALWPIVRKQGMLTMKEDAIIKAFQKKIPFEEINKL
jgi:type II secretory ATPase GspE/PulE/Tfp pilus assembly ATPase PilB-like protein